MWTSVCTWRIYWSRRFQPHEVAASNRNVLGRAIHDGAAEKCAIGENLQNPWSELAGEAIMLCMEPLCVRMMQLASFTFSFT
jgi:hypothetical protein